MNRLLKIIFSVLFGICGIALSILCFSLVHPVINWTLLIPVVIASIGSLFLAWQIASGASWRDIMDFMVDTFYWR